jgi:hypothetical protein
MVLTHWYFLSKAWRERGVSVQAHSHKVITMHGSNTLVYYSSLKHGERGVSAYTHSHKVIIMNERKYQCVRTIHDDDFM